MNRLRDAPRDAPEVQGDRLGLIVGSSLTADTIAGVASSRREVESPWGTTAVLDTGSTVVLARHGLDGFTPAHLVDHHRNVATLCAAGCDRVLALASVGNLRTWPVGTVLAPFDFFAPFANPSYYDDQRGHSVPGLHEPWRDLVISTWRDRCPTPIMDGGVYAQTRGPRFETPAEVRMLADYADVVGMTIAAECVLAKEAGLAYAVVATVDNLANGIAGEVLAIDDFHANVAANQTRLVRDLELLLPTLAEVPRP